ncbi:MAG: cas10 [Caloramator sp.]|uniref:type III-A CRISPR-associated protein Cas10/Csm1 n=1 Tax=Caloramator sp. TaxID=1871330 RepID=UPI001D7F89BB|nr:type III-A CRISPR-associated protein Cas10/Csm1 [Caloramator sp.]MBZ4663996.1 cas10 [Caloramator sp.]
MKELYAAALLHDIGKFYQRTQDNNEKEKVKRAYKTIYEQEGAYSPRHQEWGAYFCEKLNLPNINEIKRLVRNHHKPTDVYEKIISIADMLSSGEREEKEDDCKNLISVLNLVKLNRSREEKRKYKRISRLSQFNELMDNEEQNISVSYKRLWDEFEGVIKEEGDIDRIYYILNEYTSNIPSAYYYSRPDINLFSHLKTTAAIAVCLYKQFEEEIIGGDYRKIDEIYTKVKLNKELFKENVFCLIKGDISGIQSFLYNIDMEDALKNLKARSFYLSYILDIIARYIVDEEGLTLSNILYCGGGHFYIIAPNKTKERIEEYRSKIQEVLFKAHGIDVSVLLSCVEFNIGDLATADFSKVFWAAGNKLSEEKFKKFSNILNEDFFMPRENINICPYCKREIKGDICEFCESFVELGNALYRNKYVYLHKREKFTGKVKRVEDVFASFGYEIEFTDQLNKKAFSINKEGVDFKNTLGYIKTANYMFKEGSRTATLEEVSQKAQGIKRWGVLRGDVDNLGKIFLEGLGENKSISRVATLSSELEIFFGKFLEDYVRENYKECMVIYSGGDDFFIIGPWSSLPDLAYGLTHKFNDYTGGNSDITISMAIEIAPDVKFPVFRVAEDAGDSLDMAKEYERGGKTKNALSFLKDVIGWEEFEEFKEIKNDMKYLVVDKNVTRNIYYTIYSIINQYERSKEEGDLFKSWRLVYYFARLQERHKDAKENIKLLISKILKNNNSLYNKLFTATLWSDIESRG